MKTRQRFTQSPLLLITYLSTICILNAHAINALAANTDIENIQKSTETRIRNLLEPVINQYCNNDCKLLSIETNFDPIRTQKTQPGLADINLEKKRKLKLSSAKISLLLNKKAQPSEQKKLISLFNHFLGTLPFKTHLETQLTLFPEEPGSQKQVEKIRSKISQRIQNTISEVIKDFCPNQCMFTNLHFTTNLIHRDDLQTDSTRELIEDHGMVLKVQGISGTLLLDEKLSSGDQKRILELIRLKVASLGDLNLSSKIIQFPKNPQSLLLDPELQNRQLASDLSADDTNHEETRELTWPSLIVIGSLSFLLFLVTYKKFGLGRPASLSANQTATQPLTAESKPLYDSEVLMDILRKSDFDTQKGILKLTKSSYPDTFQALKSKWVTIDLLRYMQDHQILEVMLSLTRKDTVEFLMGTSSNLRSFILSKIPNDFASELQEDMHNVHLVGKEHSSISERTVVMRIQRLADQRLITLLDLNDRLFSDVLGVSEVPFQYMSQNKNASA